jgi:16S rRNA (cytosine967-C5)-methyltransferase
MSQGEREGSSDAKPPKNAPNARAVAARAFLRVERDRAFAAAALDSELERARSLPARERALATELFYGTLRSEKVLLEQITAFAPRGVDDPITRAHLLIAAYQILVLERIPTFAAVDSAVTEARKARGPKVAGFVNAVLRKLGASGKKLDRAQVIRDSAPGWLYQRLAEAVGPEEALVLLGAEPEAPRLCLRLSQGAELPEWLNDAELAKLAPHAVRVPAQAGDPRKQPGFSDGAFTIQEEGAQLVGLLLGARRGEKVLDACAGRGQKTALLRERVGAEGELWASDVHPRKLEQLAEEFARLKLAPPSTAAVDFSVGSGSVPEGFDRVLVDAPCTGTGTLRKRPEITTRLDPADPKRLGELATQIVRQAATRTKAGGRLVFAVCSVLPEEGEAVVERVNDLLEPVPFDAPELARLELGERTSLRLLPKQHGTDGYFVASFRRR